MARTSEPGRKPVHLAKPDEFRRRLDQLWAILDFEWKAIANAKCPKARPNAWIHNALRPTEELTFAKADEIYSRLLAVRPNDRALIEAQLGVFLGAQWRQFCLGKGIVEEPTLNLKDAEIEILARLLTDEVLRPRAFDESTDREQRVLARLRAYLSNLSAKDDSDAPWFRVPTPKGARAEWALSLNDWFKAKTLLDTLRETSASRGAPLSVEEYREVAKAVHQRIDLQTGEIYRRGKGKTRTQQIKDALGIGR
jgi:hypothetical protein